MTHDAQQDMATRILAGWYLLGQDSGYPDTNFNSWISFLGSHVNVQADHASYVGSLLSSSCRVGICRASPIFTRAA